MALEPDPVLRKLLDTRGVTPDKEVIVYCRSGNRSGMVQGLLKSKGFTQVRNLQGGMLAWQEIG